MTKDDVRARVDELRAPVVDAVRWDYQTRLEMLRDIALAARKDNDHRAAITAIEVANRMEVIYRATPKEEAEASKADALSELLKQVVAAKPALPIGRPNLRKEQEGTAGWELENAPPVISAT